MGYVPNFDLVADKLLGDIILDFVNRDSSVTLHLPGHPVHETGVQPFFGFRAAKLRRRLLIPLVGLSLNSFMKAVVIPVDVIGIDFVKLLQTVDLRRIRTKEELFLDAPPVTFLFAFLM